MFVLLRRVSVSVCAVALAACSLTMPPSSVTAPAPVEWNAPLPHGGLLTDLRDWWTAQDDPILLALIDGAQALREPQAVGSPARHWRTGWCLQYAYSSHTWIGCGWAMCFTAGDA